jgi:hypothetical protein
MNTLENGELVVENIRDIFDVKKLIVDLKSHDEYKKTVEYNVQMILKQVTQELQENYEIENVRIDVTNFDEKILKDIAQKLKDRDFKVKIKEQNVYKNRAWYKFLVVCKYIIVSGW